MPTRRFAVRPGRGRKQGSAAREVAASHHRHPGRACRLVVGGGRSLARADQEHRRTVERAGRLQQSVAVRGLLHDRPGHRFGHEAPGVPQ